MKRNGSSWRIPDAYQQIERWARHQRHGAVDHMRGGSSLTPTCVALALLPAITTQVYNEFDLRRTRQIEVQRQANNLADLAAAEQRQIVQGIHQALIALSELPAIKAKDAGECNVYLAKIKQRYPGFISFIVVLHLISQI